MDSVYLNQFQLVKPKNCVQQADLLNWTIKSHQTAEQQVQTSGPPNSELIEKLFRRYGVKPTQIAQRYFECDDMMTNDFDKNEIYQISSQQKHGVDISLRARFFSERAYEVFKTLYSGPNTLPRPDHLIHVTCTGYTSPSAVQRIVSEDNWKHDTDITHAYHMGCYAAMPAIRIAKSLVTSESAHKNNFTTDIVHTEMCGLHMNPLAHTPEQIIVQTLFADGHIKYTASSRIKIVGTNLKVITMHEQIIPNSQQDMTWTTASWGMQMNLSREVPAKFKTALKLFSNDLFRKANLNVADGLKSIFAIHPGGPKIIDAVRDTLELKDNQILESKNVLQERGNMSSATLPHVWNEIINNKYSVGTKIISYAFGPGLTLFGSVFEVC